LVLRLPVLRPVRIGFDVRRVLKDRKRGGGVLTCSSSMLAVSGLGRRVARVAGHGGLRKGGEKIREKRRVEERGTKSRPESNEEREQNVTQISKRTDKVRARETGVVSPCSFADEKRAVTKL
jgi:hypothetical protein